MDVILFCYLAVLSVFAIFSYGFVDRNLILSTNWLYRLIHDPLQYFAYERRGWAGITYVISLVLLFLLYLVVIKKVKNGTYSTKKVKRIFIITSLFFFFSFPSFSYDLFNYTTTAKVAFTYKENPWVIKPNEIPNDPALSYTRAANKVALYGPTWVYLTYIPHVLGLGNTWLTIYTFKTLTLIFYVLSLYLLYKISKNYLVVIFWGLNPLVQMEVLQGGHNDIVMIFFSLLALSLYSQPLIRTKMVAIFFWILSVFVKGATLILFPLFLFPNYFKKRLWVWATLFLFFVFLLTPIREELYPWYAVWFLTSLGLVSDKEKTIWGFAIALSFGMMLRYTPYIVTREYSGMNQLVRTLCPVISVSAYSLYFLITKRFEQKKKK